MIPALVTTGHPLRDAARDLVRTVYARRYGAVVHEIPDRLIALVDTDGAPVCVAGVRLVCEGCFSQAYLDEPVARALSRAVGSPVARTDILEVSCLAAARPGAAALLLRHVAAYARIHGAHWGVFTATRRLRGLIRAAHRPLITLAPALPARVPNPADWGSYYETGPWVCAVRDDATAPVALLARAGSAWNAAPPPFRHHAIVPAHE